MTTKVTVIQSECVFLTYSVDPNVPLRVTADGELEQLNSCVGWVKLPREECTVLDPEWKATIWKGAKG